MHKVRIVNSNRQMFSFTITTVILKGRDTRYDKSLRHVAATGCCNKSPRVTCENHCRCDRILSLRSVAQIQTGLNLCDTSQRQTKRKRLVAAAVQTRRLVAATCRRDMSPRFVASCVSALNKRRKLCIGLFLLFITI